VLRFTGHGKCWMRSRNLMTLAGVRLSLMRWARRRIVFTVVTGSSREPSPSHHHRTGNILNCRERVQAGDADRRGSRDRGHVYLL
jgi:hypothetical protein